MLPRIHLLRSPGVSVAEREVEIVERKGLGHPDTICDSVMEQVSLALSRTYVERYGRILHHNCDKAMLVAGSVERRLGGGRVLEPMRLILGDRATLGPRLTRDQLGEIAVQAAKDWTRAHLRHVDPERHLRYQVELRCGSEQLAGLFRETGQGVLGANDTSAAVGYAPLSETEGLVVEAERFLNSPELKSAFPCTGEDVKVMGVRTGRRLDLTIAMPLLDCSIDSETSYFQAKERILAALDAYLTPRLSRLDAVTCRLNALDRPAAGLEGMYLSVLGTSAEDADSGQVGRGNRVSGVIPLCRPGGCEATAGKNPVSHVGKIYNVLAHVLAGKIHGRIPGMKEVTVWLASRIGEPVDRPGTVAIEACLDSGVALEDLAASIQELVAAELEGMAAFCAELLEGKHAVC